MDAELVERLVAEDVAHTGEDRLVEEDGPDRTRAGEHRPQRPLPVGVVPQGIRPEGRDDVLDLWLAEQLAGARGDEVPGDLRRTEPQPGLRERWTGRVGGAQELPAHAEVDVEVHAVLGGDEQVLAPGLRYADVAAVEA